MIFNMFNNSIIFHVDAADILPSLTEYRQFQYDHRFYDVQVCFNVNQNFIHIGVPIFFTSSIDFLHALKTKYVLTVFFIKIIFSKN